MERVLITGITGQDGSYLAEYLLDLGYEVHGTIRTTTHDLTDTRIGHLTSGDDPQVTIHVTDLSDSHSLIRLIEDLVPDEVYNLAAQSHVRASFDQPIHTGQVTGLGAVRLLEAIRGADPRIRYYQASSSEMFGSAPPPQNESTPFHPRSPYAVAKVYAYWATVNYREAYGLHASNGILFNHESPRRGKEFVTRKITAAIPRLATGDSKKLFLGNLDARRDWGHARDYADGMWRILQQPEPDDYVLATGEAHSVREFVEHAFHHIGRDIEWTGEGLSERGIDAKTGDNLVDIDPRYFRPTEVESLLGDPGKAKQALGWSHKTGFAELVREMVDADLSAVKRERGRRDREG